MFCQFEQLNSHAPVEKLDRDMLDLLHCTKATSPCL
jgi:hypothetical protein